MATKEEILRDLKNRGKDITSVSMFYDFKEGDKVVMARPRPDIDLDAEIGEILSGDTILNNLYLTSLLYYRTLKDSAPAERISGILSLDNNLYNENEPQTAKTAASAAFLGKDEVICVRDDIFFSKLTPFTTLPSLTSRQGIIRFVIILPPLSPLVNQSRRYNTPCR